MVANLQQLPGTDIFTILRDFEDRVATKLAQKFTMSICRVAGGYMIGQVFVSFQRAYEITK